ncbi:MAG TPA: class I SAM-dependent methyltransferase [Ktedonobacteraceae bacterium]
MQIDLDAVTMAQVAGLRIRHHLISRELKGLLPVALPSEEFQRVLNIACGDGVWALDFARLYPKKHVIGIDTRERLLQMARENARVSGLKNIRFEHFQLDITLPYSDHRFDLIQTEQSTTTIFPYRWPDLLREQVRVLKPGGWIHLVAFEFGPTSSPAVNRFMQMLREAYARLIHTEKSSKMYITAATLYASMLHKAGCQHVEYQLFPMDLGNQYGTTGHDHLKYAILTHPAVTAFLILHNVAPQEDIEALRHEALNEIEQMDFCGAGMVISAIGQKPY